MKKLQKMQVIASAMFGMLACGASGCTPTEQTSVSDALGSSAGTAVSTLLAFTLEFGQQILAAFLF